MSEKKMSEKKMSEKRVILIVLDSVGAGEAPDAAAYGDEGSNTLGNIAAAMGGLLLPNLGALGLGNILPLAGVPPLNQADLAAAGAFGKMQEVSRGKDTTAGHWELAGTPLAQPLPTYPNGFPADLLGEFEKRIGRGTLGNVVASGTVIIQELGEEHLRTGQPIVYTSADSVFQIAAHEGIIPLPQLYEMCEIARGLLVGEHGVGRVIARPFEGEPGSFSRTANRRDFSLLPPSGNLLAAVQGAGWPVVAIGKIHDIFADQNIDFSYPTKNNADGMAQILAALDKHPSGLIWANLVDFDMLFGHRNDVAGYAAALQEFDAWLPRLLAALQPEDLLLITADHGNDPTTPSTDHSREYVPVLAWAAAMAHGVDLGVRASFADLGATAADYLGTAALPSGRSFLPELGLYKPYNGKSFPKKFNPKKFNMYVLIAKKRDGGILSPEEIRFWLQGMLNGSIPDYQTAALLMAIFWRGLDEAETFALTEEIVASGEQLDLRSIEGVTADKHSTGGVGDKTTLIAMPLAAACGLKIAKMSGRSLGKTGGTADKLASVPGFKLDLPEEELLAQVSEIGLAVVAQNKNLTPADKRLYALRDMTATVDSLPLIAASVMSKKIAAGNQVIVLDVKFGSGAFMPDADRAVELARLMVKLGRNAGRRVTAVISSMEAPLGAAVGNALEVAECAGILSGQEDLAVSADLRRLSTVLAGEMLYLGGLAADRGTGWRLAEEALADRRGWRKLLQFLQAQGGDTSALQAGNFVQAEFVLPVVADRAGYLAKADAAQVAEIVQLLGAGRERVEDEIDYQVGVRFCKPAGALVEPGDILAEVYADSLSQGKAAEGDLRRLLQILPEPPQLEPVIWGLVDENGNVLRWSETAAQSMFFQKN